MKKFVMMVGIPCSGKSTYVRNNFSDWVVLSTDDYIEEKAEAEGKTYGEVFKLYIKDAESVLERKLQSAIDQGKNIVWDQTNGTVKSRAKKLKKIPNDYTKTACLVYVPLYDALSRNITRADNTGKYIPESVIESMLKQQQPPTEKEGFDGVMTLYL